MTKKINFELNNCFLLSAVAILLSGCSYQIKTYPTCNLRCEADSGQSCEWNESDFIGAIEAVSNRTIFGKLDIIKISNGYVSFGGYDFQHKELISLWDNYMCFTSLNPLRETQYQHYESCMRNARNWTKIAIENGMDSLLVEEHYRHTCMNSSALRGSRSPAGFQ
jgi:hypothetical protein